MTRAVQTISLFLLCSSVYLAAFIGFIPLPTLVQEEIIPVLPFWALVSFGAYLLFSLGWGIFTFKVKEKEYHELKIEIEQARDDLRRKGVDVD
ncbi:dolichol-phosphate mannosyltransferase subunit 3 [Ascobolus immersus RN42]|uniref:Dolichol-phosphate mannosyltransferase subunit 3 n=1 Tax=Ascobolus immersus RN42 TaxID=1160509 RepID=A0A3N4HNL3_ASCIM|nr:dolichol-phosphate mannosyltransferase subunit 3 [Ascobolus immersus RN42]